MTENLHEKAAPGTEDWVKKNKKRFTDEYGDKKGLEVLYAKSWELAKGKKNMKEDIEAVVDMKVGGEPGNKEKTVKKKGEGDDKVDSDAKKIDDLQKLHAPKNDPNSPVIKKGEVDENLNLMFAGHELTEDFKKNASVIFEAAVKAASRNEITKMEEEFKEALEIKIQEHDAETLRQIDGYTANVVDEWAEENKIALSQGVRLNIAESFIADLKTVFEKHYISVPQEKVDMLESADKENAELRQALEASNAKIAEQEETILNLQKSEVMRGLSEGLASTQVEKLNNLVKEIDSKTIDSFKEKASIIRESVFIDAKSKKDEKVLKPLNESDDAMDRIMASFARKD